MTPINSITSGLDKDLLKFVERKIDSIHFQRAPEGAFNSIAITAIEAIREWDLRKEGKNE